MSRTRLLRIAERAIPVFLPVLTAAIASVWAVYLFVEQRREAQQSFEHQLAETAQTRLIEARKPFLSEQLGFYTRASKIVGELVSAQLDLTKGSPWMLAKQQFTSLFWAELPIVENPDVETAMVNLRDAISVYEQMPQLEGELNKRAYCLGHAIRKSIQEGWGVDVGSGNIPKQVFVNAISPPLSGAPPGDPDPDCKSEVRRK